MFRVVARLQTGVTLNAAASALDAVTRQLEIDSSDPDRLLHARRALLAEGGKLLPLRRQDLPFFTSFLLIMAGLVLLIACANLANMMLARAAQRRREIAVRLAMGASRWRVARQLLTESTIVTFAAGTVGFILSAWLMSLLSQLRMPLPVPVTYDFRPDGRVLVFTVAIAVFTGIVFGLAPALYATRMDLTPALKEGAAEFKMQRLRRFSVRNMLVVAQLAGSHTLLVILGLLSFGIQTTMSMQEGFDPSHLSMVSFDPIRDGYSPARTADFFTKLLPRVQSLPGVTSATITETVPVSLASQDVGFSVPGATGTKRVDTAIRHLVGYGYFDTTGIPIVSGRGFRQQDENDASNSVVVSAEFARVVWRAQNPVGRTIELGEDRTVTGAKILPGSIDFRRTSSDSGTRTYQVVGIAGNVPEGLVVQKPRAAVYFPLHTSDFARPALGGLTLIVRTTPGSDTIEQVRREVAALDANLTIFNTTTMAKHIDEFMSALRMAGWTYGLIGIFGLVLAAVGLGGMTAYFVAQRTHEIGIRMALGARRTNVLGLVMREGALLALIGTGIGAVFAFVGSRALSAMNSAVGTVTSTSASNPIVLIGAPSLLVVLALAACYLPARRSVQVDPMVTLRHE